MSFITILKNYILTALVLITVSYLADTSIASPLLITRYRFPSSVVFLTKFLLYKEYRP